MNAALPNSLEKAAIVVASLDSDSADALLEHIEPELAARVRNAMMQLDKIDPEQQQHVIQEFVNRNPVTVVDTDDGVEIDASLAQKLATETVQAPDRIDVAEKAAVPFASLRDVSASTLATLLIREHPQTIAIVAAHLDPRQAADVLGHLPDHLQTEVLMRIARLDKPAPDVIQDLESEVNSLLAHRQTEPRTTENGVRAVTAILESSDEQQRRCWVTRLAAHDETFSSVVKGAAAHRVASSAYQSDDDRETAMDAHRHTTDAPCIASAAVTSVDDSGANTNSAEPARMSFANFEKLSDVAIARVLATADPKLTLIALAGASRGLVQRIMDHLEPGQATRLELKMQQIGPIRLEDIERAQQYLADLAAGMNPPPVTPRTAKHRFVVAA